MTRIENYLVVNSEKETIQFNCNKNNKSNNLGNYPKETDVKHKKIVVKKINK